jgi:uncharacterized protein with HEPN domain
MTREWKFFIQDIYDAIQHIKTFVGTMKSKEFLAVIRPGAPSLLRLKISEKRLRISPRI